MRHRLNGEPFSVDIGILTQWDDRLRFFTEDSYNGEGTERMTILENNNVGIGGIIPAGRLHIAGDSGDTDTTWTNAALWIQNTNPTQLRSFSLSTQAYAWEVWRPSFVIRDETAGQIRFLINEAGDIGMGTTAGPLAKLGVGEDIRAEPNSWGTCVWRTVPEGWRWWRCENGEFVAGVGYEPAEWEDILDNHIYPELN